MDQAQKSIPFGYTLVNEANEGPPSGPPLLDNNEQGYLQEFFNNPNNIDPSFLGASQHAARHGGGPDSFPVAGQHQQNWMMDCGSSYPSHSPMDFKQQQQQQQQHDQHHHNHHHHQQQQQQQQQQSSLDAAAAQQARYSVSYAQQFAAGQQQQQQQQPPPPPPPQQQQQQHGTTEDVYAAARLLQANASGSSNGQPDSSSFDYAQAQSNVSNTGQGYRYANGVGRGGAPERADPKRGRPLNFGSDSKFRMNKYAAPKNQAWPDQDLVQAVLAAQPSGLQHNPWDQGKRREEGEESPTARKRRRSPVEGEESDDAEGSSADSGGKRKRMDGDEDGDEALSRGRGSKRKSGRSGSPSKSKRSPTLKATKENLSEEQKRANHIQSEQKRRNLIRQGFEDANKMVPELRAGGFSKSNMLLEAAKFMRELKASNAQLQAVMDLLDKG